MPPYSDEDDFDVGTRDFWFGFIGMSLMIGVAVLFAIFA
jgi:hypothetical protein